MLCRGVMAMVARAWSCECFKYDGVVSEDEATELVACDVLPTLLPPNTSAFLQPLDDAVAAAMKRLAAVSLAKLKTARF